MVEETLNPNGLMRATRDTVNVCGSFSSLVRVTYEHKDIYTNVNVLRGSCQN